MANSSLPPPMLPPIRLTNYNFLSAQTACLSPVKLVERGWSIIDGLDDSAVPVHPANDPSSEIGRAQDQGLGFGIGLGDFILRTRDCEVSYLPFMKLRQPGSELPPDAPAGIGVSAAIRKRLTLPGDPLVGSIERTLFSVINKEAIPILLIKDELAVRGFKAAASYGFEVVRRAEADSRFGIPPMSDPGENETVIEWALDVELARIFEDQTK